MFILTIEESVQLKGLESRRKKNVIETGVFLAIFGDIV
jgi:hypothetical protein